MAAVSQEQQATCRICGCSAAHPRYRVREMMFGTREEFDYFQCQACECLQIAEMPCDIARHYPPNYYSLSRRAPPAKAEPPIAAFVNGVGKRLQRWRVNTALFGRGYKLARLAALAVDLPDELWTYGPWLRAAGVRSFDAAFLDVGCGSWSWWLDALEKLGFRNLHGLDPYIDSDAHQGGALIRHGTIDSISESFDVISMHHVLEHIADQRGTLAAVRERLANGGACIVRIPTVSSLAWETYGTDWVELDAPRHLYLHSIKSFERLVRDCGFRIEHRFWDSVAFEFYGSEQYRRGIALTAENSFVVKPNRSDFTFREMDDFRRIAAKACKEGRGGRIGFILTQSR